MFRLHKYFLCAFSLMLSGAALADRNDVETLQRYTPTGEHRLDLSYTRIDGFDSDINLLLFGYTRAIRPNLRIGLTGSYARTEGADDSSGTRSESGLSDSLIELQYDPSKRLTAAPWIPNSVGFNAAVRVPTGNEKKNLGADSWAASIGGGWAIDFYSNFWVIPALSYQFTFREGDGAVRQESIAAEVDIVWLFPFGGWVGAAPILVRDFEFDDWGLDYRLIVGKMWRNGFGLSLEGGRDDRLDNLRARDDRIWLANVYYQF